MQKHDLDQPEFYRGLGRWHSGDQSAVTLRRRLSFYCQSEIEQPSQITWPLLGHALTVRLRREVSRWQSRPSEAMLNRTTPIEA